jgi:hypothetical protein
MTSYYRNMLLLDEARRLLFREERFGEFADLDAELKQEISAISWAGFMREMADSEVIVVNGSQFE